ncbi:hypothetical protein FACS189419_07370 [Planctomycetales bacterium]|nr:hypothetical protein FACS189419_07370 [Planctomycetales bacterium]
MKHFLFSLPLFFLAVSAVNADETPNPVLPELKEIVTSGPYCGIYSFVAVAKTLGVQPDIKTLLVPKYVGSSQGSSNRELEKLAEDNGLYAKSYGGLTWHEIKNSKTPMILHFRSSFADSKFNHWVAYLGADGKHARIIDFPHPLSTITFAELLAKWDGAAIAVSDKPIDASLAFASHLHYLYLVGWQTLSLVYGLLFLSAGRVALLFFYQRQKNVQ